MVDTYTITLTDGSSYTFDVTNGQDGTDGKDGKDGVSVTSVQQSVTSSEDGGNNIITVTLSNGQSSTFIVKNGSKGSQGEKGDKGDKGENGNDYVLTSADKTEIANAVLDSLQTAEGGIY